MSSRNRYTPRPRTKPVSTPGDQSDAPTPPVQRAPNQPDTINQGNVVDLADTAASIYADEFVESAPTRELAIDLVITAGQLIRRVAREALSGDRAATWRALSIIEQYPGLRVGKFAKAYACSQPVATRHVHNLVNSGLVERVIGDDARVTNLYLTDAGREHLQAHRELVANYLAPTFNFLSDGDQRAVRRTIAIIETALRDPDAPDSVMY
ncbi:hypothetical protein C1Y63_01485 [Corynebacterium sp. 13CS0277]|uniref:MarR family winged helix-turn-helix transcriptional regulator n=1 Tax=Corynebacterium sp. 13CS0277 TaxID=2071994 RepID=UPI000D032445|nr:MarR family transcriptional regulator [Corynebacterium sp. 13CS0277]PRQ12262.1 hypothetical protein C1Y63_01485 [Corynebacterium sp. 13CS0277]